MTSLADELSAAMCPSEGSTNGLTQIDGSNNTENNKNIANVSSPKNSPLDDIGTKCIKDEYPSAFKASEDMEMTCGITMPPIRVMKLEGNTDIVGSTMSYDDISLEYNKTSFSPPTTLRINEEENELSNINTSFERYSDNSSEKDTNITSSINEQAIHSNIGNSTDVLNNEKTCLWSHISTDFDPEEETANFGTRYAVENDGKLFDVVTFATIEPKVRNSKIHNDIRGLISLPYRSIFDHDFINLIF